MGFFWIFNINQDVVHIYYNKNIKLFNQDLIYIALEIGWYIWKPKKHNLLVKMTILGTKNCFLFIAFWNPHWMISTSEIQLCKSLGLA